MKKPAFGGLWAMQRLLDGSPGRAHPGRAQIVGCLPHRFGNVKRQARNFGLRGKDLNLRPSGYEPDELPDCWI